ncbi:MAG: hypothetical protein ACUVWX_14035 [Kiritimatiellia bacterium]
MKVTYCGLDQKRSGLYVNSILHKRVEVELSHYDLELSPEIHFSLRPCKDEGEGVELVCCAARSDNGDRPTEIGSVRIPRRAFEIYPYYPGDSLIQTILTAVHRLAQQAVTLTPLETRLEQKIG